MEQLLGMNISDILKVLGLAILPISELRGAIPVAVLEYDFPWYRDTGWPRIWWNLNIETLYLPVYTGNRLELGESFTNFIDTGVFGLLLYGYY